MERSACGNHSVRVRRTTAREWLSYVGTVTVIVVRQNPSAIRVAIGLWLAVLPALQLSTTDSSPRVGVVEVHGVRLQ